MTDPGARLLPAAACGVLAVLGATALHAAEAMNGRWAAEPSACTGVGPAPALLVVMNEAVRWSDDICRIGRAYRTGDTLYLAALCEGRRTISVTMRRHGNRMQLRWGRGITANLHRCS
jgi:hypothetical protein